MRKKKRYATFVLKIACAMALTTITPATSIALAANEMTIALQESKSKSDSIQGLYLGVGESRDLKFFKAPANWDKLKPTWTSSNKKIATVNSSGVVKGIAKGTATITFSLSNKMTGTVKVTVGTPITLGTKDNKAMTQVTLSLKESIDLDFYGMSDWNKETCVCQWIATGDSVTVDSDGIITAVKNGNSTVSLTIKNTKTGVLYTTIPITVIVDEQKEEDKQSNEPAEPSQKVEKEGKDTQFTYHLLEDESGYCITEYFGKNKKVVIPKKFNGLPVKEIGEEVFEYSRLTSIEIPNSVVSIGESAFCCCSNLKSIKIPSSVTSIGNNAFLECNNLKTIEIPSSVTNIGQDAFVNTLWLDNQLKKKEFVIVNGILIATIPTISGDVKIPNSVTSIGGAAFYNCNNLESIELPNSVTSIEEWAFYKCTNLKSIELSNNITSIGEYAFCNCSNLESIELPNSVIKIGESAFSDCSKLENFELPNSVTSIGEYAFFRCNSLTSIKIPNSVTGIGKYAFRDCKNLENVEINSDVINIGQDAFSGTLWSNKQLQEKGFVIINGMLIEVPYDISGRVKIPDNVTSISEYVFDYCNKVSSIELPSGITSIGQYAFLGCSRLSSIVIPDSVTNIGAYAFSGCNKLSSIVIPNSVTNIGAYAFLGCGSLSSIELPNSLVNIEEGTFSCCIGLSNVKLPSSVISIGQYAFNACRNLVSIELSNSVMNIQKGAFRNCSNLLSIELPSSVVSIGEKAFYGCNNLENIKILNNMVSIEDMAFKDCEKLDKSCIPSNLYRDSLFNQMSLKDNSKYISERYGYKVGDKMLTSNEETLIYQGTDIWLDKSGNIYSVIYDSGEQFYWVKGTVAKEGEQPISERLGYKPGDSIFYKSLNDFYRIYIGNDKWYQDNEPSDTQFAVLSEGKLYFYDVME